MIYRQGFYKYDDQLLYGPNFIMNANYQLLKESHAEYTYPVDGWYWFNSLEEACNHFGINIEDYLDDEDLLT